MADIIAFPLNPAPTIEPEPSWALLTPDEVLSDYLAWHAETRAMIEREVAAEVAAVRRSQIRLVK